MMYFDINSVFAARGISHPIEELIEAGMQPQTARNLVNRPPKTILFPHLEIICRICYCTPNDLIRYKPNQEISLPENHPINELKNHALDTSAIDIIRMMPFNKLKQMVQSINKNEETAGNQAN